MWFGPQHFENAKRCFLYEKQKCWREKTSQFPVMSQLYYELIDKIWSSSQWWSSDVAQYDQLHQSPLPVYLSLSARFVPHVIISLEIEFVIN